MEIAINILVMKLSGFVATDGRSLIVTGKRVKREEISIYICTILLRQKIPSVFWIVISLTLSYFGSHGSLLGQYNTYKTRQRRSRLNFKSWCQSQIISNNCTISTLYGRCCWSWSRNRLSLVFWRAIRSWSQSH